MKKVFFVLALFLLQNYLITNGTSVFNKLVAPFLIFSVSALIAIWYYKTILADRQQNPDTASPAFQKQRFLGFFIGVFSIVILWKPFVHAFALFPDPGSCSDIIPQLTTLYSRFSRGIQPYFPLEQFAWHPFPVYMPLHWLPVGLGYFLKIDVRWAGFIFLSVSCGVLGYHLWGSANSLKKMIAIVLPAIVLCSFIHWAKQDIAVAFELVVAAYYLLLAIGLLSGNLVLITVGIIACLLSRYTLVFWLPLFFILLWSNASKKKNLVVWSSIILAAIALYVVPFYLRDPSILSKGLHYHNMCYVDAWDGLGHPEQTTAFDKGLNFSWFICHTFTGDLYRRVFIARVIQAMLMLALLAAGILLYRKWKHRVRYDHFSLGMLYCVMMVFFMFSPFTYTYYYIPFLCVSAALCGKIILTK